MSVLTIREKGKKVLALGNEAIARGALEAKIGFASTYPGTPASEVGDSIYEVLNELKGLHFEYSMNEMTAALGGIGAAWAGVRAMVSMKLVGVNVAADALMNVAYRSVKGMVLINGGDPGMGSSSTEQENRFFCQLAHIPCLAPSTIQEAKDFTKKAFEIAEEFAVPVMVDLPTQLSHSLGVLELGELPEEFPTTGRFVGPIMPKRGSVPKTWLHQHVLEREAACAKYAASSELNRILPGKGRWGIITSGTCFGYTMEALDLLGLRDVPVLKLGIVYPLSQDLIKKFIQGLDEVVIVEELEGFLEHQIKRMAYDMGVRLSIAGKELFSPIGPLSTSTVTNVLSRRLEVPLPPKMKEGLDREQKMRTEPSMAVPARVETQCAGCPHRGSYYALKKATRGKMLLGGDIGCYALPPSPRGPFLSWHLCMGVGIGAAQAVARKIKDMPVVPVIGDSTFYHAGIPHILNAVYNKADVLLLVLDNHWTAMTGHQPVPSTRVAIDGTPFEGVSIESVLQGIGVKYIRKVDPYRPREMEDVLKAALKEKGVRVVIAERECVLQADRRKRKDASHGRTYYSIEPERCQKCDVCFLEFACPAIQSRREDGDWVYYIDDGLCTGCGACKELCPNSAIHITTINPHLQRARV
ncbi:MAG: 4Fe-4S binding protein [Chloroflexi bacterium]|nr:4Fe-4S binding protein [Chloroflexota bacterium]